MKIKHLYNYLHNTLINIFLLQIWDYFCPTKSVTKMTTKTNTRNLKVGSTITLSYNNGTFKTFEVTRVEEKSWYCGKWRKSFGTIEEWFKCPNDIVKVEIN